MTLCRARRPCYAAKHAAFRALRRPVELWFGRERNMSVIDAINRWDKRYGWSLLGFVLAAIFGTLAIPIIWPTDLLNLTPI